MRSIRTKAAVLCAAAALTLAGAGLGAGAASAHAVPQGSCGSGFVKVGSHKLTADWGKPHVGGTVTVYYNRSTGKNCAIARPIHAWAGKAKNVSVWMQRLPHGARDADSSDSYRFYAGPIYVSARHKCIRVFAQVKSPQGEIYVGGTPRGYCR
ncbi:hypothetical protein [Sinosporangium siamense]|uniref:Uncharacterized protein n=1 Tax=Sinosporangium siamense TaxID=1367973 RepID=A0A919V4R7_9ACTN|nr:hypothetical protein [Sinosporangium siamense]GII92205.1 hypothetical protein Ssi02_24360 [Sinosporangium siamense]